MVSDYYLTRQLAGGDITNYERRCREAEQAGWSVESEAGAKALKGFQLRFINRQVYVIEAVCRSPYVKPMVVDQHRLLLGITKVFGSGVTLSLRGNNLRQGETVQEPTGLVVVEGLGGRNRQVGLWQGEGVNVIKKGEFDPLGLKDAPETTCEGASGQCCSQQLTAGIGPRLATSDCPDGCFTQCQARPTVVILETNPVVDEVSREVTILGKNTQVEFGYKILDSDGYIKEATLFFGDGQKQTDAGIPHLPEESEVNHELAKLVGHTYVCRESICTYRVQLTATDDDDQPLSDSRLNSLTIYQYTQE